MIDSSSSSMTIYPAFDSPLRPVWEGAVWTGAIEVSDMRDEAPGRCRLSGSDGYHRARLLVRDHGDPLGFVELDVTDGELDLVELRRVVATLPAPEATGMTAIDTTPSASPPRTSVTVVVCTRDRADSLAVAVKSILATDYPDFDMIVVDNASRTDATRTLMLELGDPRVRLVSEPRPGLSRARNTGLLEARGRIVAFTDDDVVVDRGWLRALVDGFVRGQSVACVSGMVPTGEIRTPAQAYFDRRVGWADYTEPRLFDLANPPGDVPLFPFAVGRYGTGANFAVKRDVVLVLGGFDEALGAGAPTDGGEDLDMFFRILYSGRQLVYEPAAIVWHRHRAENDGLFAQARGYGLGLGAWLGKIAVDPDIARLAVGTALRRMPAVIRHIRKMSNDVSPPANLEVTLPSGIQAATLKSIVRGPWAYRLARRQGRSPIPLRRSPRP